MIKFKCLSIVSLLFLLGFTIWIIGCGVLHHQVKPVKETVIEEETFPKLIVPYSLTIRESSQIGSKTYQLCGPHYVDVKDMSNCTIGLLKDIFKNNNININDKGEKQLVLTSIEAKCIRGAFGLTHEVELKLNAGDLIKKQFKGTRSSDGFATTWAIERSIGDAVRKMLEDPDILQYLKGKPAIIEK